MKSKKINRFRVLFNKNKRFRIISIVAGLIVAIMVLGVFSFLMGRMETSGKITAAISVEPENLDPTFCQNNETQTILVNCFEGLMKIDENGDAVKAAASDYTVSKDGKVYTFTISSDAKWSNGTDVKASDFVYAWRRTANPYNSSAYAFLFENIRGYDTVMQDFEKEQNKVTDEDGNYITMDMSKLWVKAADSKTLVVRLKEKDPSFLKKCASVAFFPLCEQVVKPNTRIWSTDADLFVSNGAFVLSSWTEGSYLDLVPNEDFRDSENVKLKAIKFRFVADGNEGLEMFKSNDVLFSSSLPEDKIESVARKRDFNSYDELGTYFLYFNHSKKPFNDPRVRQALTLAIDREKLVDETALSRGIAASALISDGFSAFREKGNDYFDVSKNRENKEKARLLLKEAGYENGEDFPEFEYIFNDNTYSRKTAELIQKMWKKNLGIECTLKSVSWSKLDELRNSGDFYVAKGGLMAPYNDVKFMLDKFTSENSFCGWYNVQYDKLVSKVTNNNSSYAHKAEDMLMENWVICPLYYYSNGYLASSRINNYYVTNQGVAYFTYADVNVF